ncbi:LysR family transcriptional regulator [Teichococcus aestuarii]
MNWSGQDFSGAWSEAPALSHAMRTLEGRLDIRLLDRTTRSLSPTSAGEQLLLRLRPALASVEDMLAELDQARDRPMGRVHINAHRPAAVHVVLPAWRRWRSASRR